MQVARSRVTCNVAAIPTIQCYHYFGNIIMRGLHKRANNNQNNLSQEY